MCQLYGAGDDHIATLEGFAKWRQALPSEERYGLWHLLTACYGQAVEGLSYVRVSSAWLDMT